MKTEYAHKKDLERRKKKYHAARGREKQRARRHRRFLELTGGIILIKGMI